MRLPRFRKRTLLLAVPLIALSLTAFALEIWRRAEDMRSQHRNAQWAQENAQWAQESAKNQREVDLRVSTNPKAALLDEPSPGKRVASVKSLGSDAVRRKLEIPPPQLVACLDDKDEAVRMAAADALIEYGEGPELVVPVALRRLPGESPRVRQAFSSVFWHVRLRPSVLPLLTQGLTSENTGVCLVCTAAINHMGREAAPALPAILALLRKELEAPHPTDPADPESTSVRIIAMASGAVGEIGPETGVPPEAVELLRQVLERPGGTKQVSSAPVKPGRPERFELENADGEAAWSLGILGAAAVSAVPVLIATLEAAPGTSDLLRGLIAEALVAIARGTPDEDRVLTCLSAAWKTASEPQKPVLARALRNLGPKSEQLVPDLKQLPADGTRSAIRRVRYPRSRREQPIRE